jgi:lipoyl(octanoyl) transferase
LGRVRYRPTVALQERLRAAILRGEPRQTLLLCEHHPVITLGRRGRAEHILRSSEQLAASGIEVEPASRGGEVTYHGPGQLVGYPVLRLRRGVVAHLEAMASGIVTVLAQLGIDAEWRRACPGVWVGDAKICAFGVHVRHGVAIHGFALNVSPDLDHFATIVPCGMPDAQVTSIAALLGQPPGPHQLVPGLIAAFTQTFVQTFVAVEPDQLTAALATEPPDLDCKSEIETDTMIQA